MNTEIEKKAAAKPTGRRYKSVTELIERECLPDEVRGQFVENQRDTEIVEQLALMRQGTGITQEQMAEKLGVTQSAISKLEAGRDENLTLAQIREYSKATDQRIGILFGKPMNHVEAVKAHALGIRRHLSSLASIAHQDDELENAIQGFFGEAFFNILTILAKCQDEMPNSEDVKITFQTLESAPASRDRLRRTGDLVAA
jgi:transcriptional regulator with XRE-family HTH domain